MFKPWIGKTYESTKSPRTLILGESHYGNSHIDYNYPIEDKTIRCIQEQIDNSWVGRYFTKVVSTNLGHRPTLEEKGSFWNSVSYHNLITEPLEAARRAPTQEQWATSLQTLPTVIKELKPDYCICIGYRMWNQIKDQFDLELLATRSDIGPCGAVFSKEMNCVFHGIKHPSGRGYRNSEWHTHITNLKNERWG